MSSIKKTDFYYNSEQNIIEAFIDNLNSIDSSFKDFSGVIRRYARRNQIYRKIFGLNKIKNRGHLSVFIIRNNAIELGVVDVIVKLLKSNGFVILHKNEIDKKKINKISKRFRGGNWKTGAISLEASGKPEAIIICYDPNPLPLSKKIYVNYPDMDNGRLYVKRHYRYLINSFLGKNQASNFLHVTDNEKQAWRYIRTIDNKLEPYIKAKIKLKFENHNNVNTFNRDYKLAYLFLPYFIKQVYLFLWWRYQVFKNRIYRYNQDNLSIYKDIFRPKYGNYPLNPLKIKYIYDQSKNDIFIRKFDMNLLFSGDWENKSPEQKIENSVLYKSAISRYFDSKPWYETSYFKQKLNSRMDNKKVNAITNHIIGLDSLYNKMKREGYISQKNLSPLFPSAKAIQGWGEVAINIGEKGNIYLSQGRHRAIFSIILGLDTIQTNIIARHTNWANFKEEIIDYLELNGGKIDFPLEHVDLQFIPSKYNGESLEFFKDKLLDNSSRILLIDDKWGFFAAELEKLGHECLVFKQNSIDLYFMERLRSINKNKFTIINNISELIKETKGKEYDLVLSFLPLKNFQSEKFKELLQVIDIIKVRSFFFQDYTLNDELDKKINPDIFFDNLISSTSFSNYQKSSKLYDNIPVFQLIR